MTRFTMYTLQCLKVMKMNEKMINDFIKEVKNHPHREELIELMISQLEDMNSVKYLELNADRI